MKSSLKSFFIASFISTFGMSQLAAATQMQATVVSKVGKAEVQDANDSTKWIPLEAGSTLSKGAVIQTGFKSELVLKIKGTEIKVAPLTRMTLEQLVEKDGKDDTKIFLDTGSLKSNVKKSEDRSVGFQVRTPVATASVRGTVLEVKNKYKSTDVKTHEGTVAVWKTKNNTAKVTSEAEDDAPAFIPSATDTAPASISDDAPPSAFTVTKGQTAGFASNGTTQSTQSNAAKVAYGMPSATKTASASESETSTAVPPPPTNPRIPVEHKEKAPARGSINVSVEWQ